jgi:pyruvate formate lyase activating enzyme
VRSATGLVFNIQGYSLHDGPGIRTVVFLKGCPLECLWCCNPESRSRYPEVEFVPLECIQCGRCVEVCPVGAIAADLAAPDGKIDRGLCDACMACVWACPSGALRAVGVEMTVDQVMAAVMRDAPFYRRSGGGVTLSGGEPLAQWEFARGIARACQERNVSVALETTGVARWDSLAAVLEFTDLVLYDLKQMDDRTHRAATGISNALPLANLRRLADLGVPFVLRLPLVPGHNLEAGHLQAAGALAAELGAREIHLMPFHQLGSDKYRRFGLDYALAGLPALRDTPVGREQVEWARRVVAEFGVPVVVGGG